VPLLKGCALATAGQAAEAVHSLKSGLAFWQTVGMECTLPFFKGTLTSALATSGDIAGALTTIDEALADVGELGSVRPRRSSGGSRATYFGSGGTGHLRLKPAMRQR
jgi:hypothetical protein